MSKIIRYTAEEKHVILKAYEDGIWSMRKIASMYQNEITKSCKDIVYNDGTLGDVISFIN